MKAKLIKNWEDQAEKSLRFQKEMENWWKVEIRDYAASNLRDYNIENEEELKDLAIYVLEKFNVDINKSNIEIAIDILSVYVNFEVNESLNDILKPKSQEEIDQALDRWTLEEKIDIINNNIDVDSLYDYLISAGGKVEDLVKPFLEDASEEELKEFILEIIGDDEDYLQWLIQIVSYDEKKLKEIFKKFINSSEKEELEEIINNMILQNPEIIRSPRRYRL